MAVGLALALGAPSPASSGKSAMPGLSGGSSAGSGGGAGPSKTAQKKAKKKAKKKRLAEPKAAVSSSPSSATPVPTSAPPKPSETIALPEKKGMEREESIALPDNEPIPFGNGQHPFFTLDPSEDAGHFQSLSNLHPTSPGFHHVVRTPEGFLLWLGERGSIIHILTANGLYWPLPVPGNSSLLSLVKDAKDRLWFFGDKTHGQLNLKTLRRPGGGIQLHHRLGHESNAKRDLATGPTCVVATRDGSLLGATAGDSHAYGKMHDKSQFNMAYATREALDELIAQGIEEAGPHAWGSVTDFEGRYYTLCQRRGTDWFLTRDGWEPTELFVVVSDRYYNPAVDDYDHVVVTAYPVSKDW